MSNFNIDIFIFSVGIVFISHWIIILKKATVPLPRLHPLALHQLQKKISFDSTIIRPSFLEGGPIMYRSCPSVCLSVCPMPPPRGKTKRPTNTKLGRRVPGTRASRGPISRSKGQRSRSRRLIALLAKNPPPPKHAHHVASSSLNDSRDGSTCCRRVVARTYSTARTTP